MKIIMTLLVRDEEDIIRENIEYHSSIGIDYFIAIDNGSQGGTKEILLEYEKRGILKYIYESGYYSQSRWCTVMANLAYDKYGADWVISNDADEFWYHGSNDLKSALSKVPQRYPIVRVNRYNMLINVNSNESTFYKRMTYRYKKSQNLDGKPLPSKVCCRGANNVFVLPGSHGMRHPHGRQEFNSDLMIFHYPVRSRNQAVSKIVNIGSGYENNPQINEKTKARPGSAMRKAYENYKNDPEYLETFLKQYTVPKWSIQTFISRLSNPIVKDERMSNYLSIVMKDR